MRIFDVNKNELINSETTITRNCVFSQYSNAYFFIYLHLHTEMRMLYYTKQQKRG